MTKFSLIPSGQLIKEGIVAYNRLDWEKLFNKLPRCLLLKRPTWTTLIESSVHISLFVPKVVVKLGGTTNYLS
jgi:hypothetical protein